MSLINDALKQARKEPPRNVPSALPSMQPVAHEASPRSAWLLPALAILLAVAATSFIGWTVTHRHAETVAAVPQKDEVVVPPPAPTPPPATPLVAASSVPASAPVAPSLAQPQPTPADAPPSPPAKPASTPKLQGIFYTPTSPSAIVDGETVRPGDQFRQYRVKTISKTGVVLVGPDQKEIQLGMDN